jgi:hypothetical protein
VQSVGAPPGDRKTVYCPITLDDDTRQKLASTRSVEQWSVINDMIRQISDNVAARSSSTGPRYQIRLFSCSEDYYVPGSNYPYATTIKSWQPRGPAPIEFPSACELRLNGVTVSANLRGIKKKEGTVNPPDLSDMKKDPSSKDFVFDIRQGASNKVEMTYVNTDKVWLGLLFLSMRRRDFLADAFFF